ncbi:PREDICTED: centrosomal protein of 170 kDa-like isoform X1 [Poecilia mexicana]|uniref:centrosomal protein of 170 kDa-like isoform X1 n=1 Tax=Poecilia mexicana TaxID=48701 RepID=UPI00072EB6FF|nr:PREDICTED: centrosomal protein of 170 kDa-like isoform X1 [Poecilia mexicana]XP_014833757.1 PREDICTED: centrosomal protein of 170 kDa-like isoform X1 [Poecilia mexicana]XP_014833761.1 PREDICTED: centrosomal protein of 170 kDa-like isoform X1 [Poecilia mexicana]XP_014833768.1 PREDICTED: centrosomal protein of 170 kDa-like isoform X1 [Poecilia mexicana]
MSLTSWFLVSSGGTRHRLPREMIFVGRDDCELMLQSRSVDKQHAVINYEPNADEHKVKDLGSLNGTFVNDVRIQEQDYVTLKTDDKLRFGYDTNLFTVVRGELHIPEEALKHEKLSSQLQMIQKKPAEKCEAKPSEAEAASGSEGAASKPPESGKPEDKTVGDIAVLHRGTPLYGQPAWWGDGDTDDQQPGKPDEKTSDRKKEKAEMDTKRSAEIPKSLPQAVSNQEPSYFEIPTKDAPVAAKLSELPPQDQETNASAAAVEPIHGHASFTIEFDPGASGKVLVKDRVAKVGPETRPRPKRAGGEDLSPLQTAMVAAEVKVADWLAQNELPLALKETVAEDDGESVKSDVPVHLRSLKGSKHEDGTQSDSENALGEQRRAAALEERSWGLWGGAGIKEGRANVPEGLFAEEDSPARRCKSSASKRQSGLVERRRGSAPHQHGGREECYGHRDEYSDRGTYTIELENGANEEKEARKLIDKVKVFGVDEQRVSRMGGIDQRERLSSQRSGSRDRGKPGRLETELLSEELMVGGPRWVSQWATLAASHIRTDPEGSGGDSHTLVTENRAEISGSSHMASVHTERKRRTLPQLPGEEVNLGRKTQGGCLNTDMGEKQDTELQEKENPDERLSRGKKQSVQGTGGVGSQSGSPSRSSPAKSQDSGGGKSNQSGVLSKVPPRPLTSGQKRMEEARRRKKDEEKTRESTGKPLLRQESFTVEKPSSSVPIELIPRIDAYTGTKTQSRDGGIDSVSMQKDSEAVAAFLESTVSDQGDPPSQSIEGSMSPESDVDTTSTVSQADGVRKVVQKRRILTGQQKERTVLCTSNKGPTGSREPLDRRGKNRTSGPQQPSHPSTSLDLTDDDINSNSLLSDSQPISTQDSRSSNLRGQTVGASTKSSRAKMTQPSPSSAPNKASNVPKPRPTRTSLLRRARLGESSDTEPADMDRMSVASEASTASSTSRTGIARRGMSRIEALAQPRRPRVGSPSAQSDSEATVAKSRGPSGRSAAGDYALRQGLRGSNVASLSGPRARANSASKLPDKTKGTSSYGHITPASGTRWRRVPVEYASTSEDEYGSNRHISKQGPTRPFPSTRVAQLGGSAPATPNPAGLTSVKQNSRDQDEYMRDWTAHSEEIARISQDLAKDLAMLAREIHDVAGEIDSVSPAATDPGALLEESVFDDGLDLGGSTAEQSRIPAGEGRTVELRQRSSNNQSSRSIRRQTWNRDDLYLDNVLLASVTQLSTRIRQSVDKTTCKVRILFKDKERKWDEIETKLQAEHDSLVLKSSNKEISTIIQDLKSVEKQLSVIDMMVDPDGTLDALSSMGLTSPLSDQRTSPGSQQGAQALHSRTETKTSSTPSAPRHEELSGEPCGSSERTEETKQGKSVASEN